MGESHYQRDVEQLYARTLGQGIRSLAICSALPQQGATTLLSVLAQRNVLAGHSTLLVDLNFARPGIVKVIDLPVAPALSSGQKPALVEALAERVIPQLVSVAGGEALFNGMAIPQDKGSMLQLRNPDTLRALIQGWQEEYDTVLVDCAAVLARDECSVPAQQAASACEACLLVVLSGYSTQTQLKEAVEYLNQQSVNLIGTVMNDQYSPRLLDEIKRELNRLHGLSPRFVRWASKKLNQVPFLSMDI